METLLEQYVQESDKLQRLETKSGGYYTGGLGEPKYYANGTPYNEPVRPLDASFRQRVLTAYTVGSPSTGWTCSPCYRSD